MPDCFGTLVSPSIVMTDAACVVDNSALLDGAIALKTDNMMFPSEIYATELKFFQFHPENNPDNIPNLAVFKLDGKIQINLKLSDIQDLVWFFPSDESENTWFTFVLCDINY